jgi:hypothetical protein
MSEAIGLPGIALFFFVVPGIWVVGVILLGSKPKRLALWTLPFLLLYAAPIIAANVLGRYLLTVEFRDAHQRPITDMPVSYERTILFPLFGRMVRPASHLVTDGNGRISIPANHNNSFTIAPSAGASSQPIVRLETHDSSQPHYLSSDHSEIAVSRPVARRESGGFLIPPGSDIQLLVTLKSQ